MAEIVYVSGGAGFIGSHLVDSLIENGYRVRVLDNLIPQVHGSLREQGGWPDYCHPDAEYIFGDVRDRAAVLAAVKDVDYIVHLAAMVGVGQSMYEVDTYVDVNIRGTAVLLDILANETDIRSRIKKLCVASSMSNYGEGRYTCAQHGLVSPPLRSLAQLEQHDWKMRCPIDEGAGVCDKVLTPVPTDETKPLHTNSIYAISKKAQEEMCITLGEIYRIPTVATRFFNTYGTRQALSNPYTGVAAIFCNRLLNGNVPHIFEDGMQVRDFVHISDLVQGIMLLLTTPEATGVYNVGSGRPIRIIDVANEICRQFDESLSAEILNTFRAGDIRHCYGDISKLKQLGYEPKVRFEDGIKELIDWLRRQNATQDAFESMKQTMASRGLTG